MFLMERKLASLFLMNSPRQLSERFKVPVSHILVVFQLLFHVNHIDISLFRVKEEVLKTGGNLGARFNSFSVFVCGVWRGCMLCVLFFEFNDE
jgi:hypothetical protein